jgi:hypothetical protein
MSSSTSSNRISQTLNQGSKQNNNLLSPSNSTKTPNNTFKTPSTRNKTNDDKENLLGTARSVHGTGKSTKSVKSTFASPSYMYQNDEPLQDLTAAFQNDAKVVMVDGGEVVGRKSGSSFGDKSQAESKLDKTNTASKPLTKIDKENAPTMAKSEKSNKPVLKPSNNGNVKKTVAKDISIPKDTITKPIKKAPRSTSQSSVLRNMR